MQVLSFTCYFHHSALISLMLKYVLIKLLAYHEVIYTAHVMNNKLFVEILVFLKSLHYYYYISVRFQRLQYEFFLFLQI